MSVCVWRGCGIREQGVGWIGRYVEGAECVFTSYGQVDVFPGSAKDVGQLAGVSAEVLWPCLLDQQELVVVHQQVVAIILQRLTILGPCQLGDW